MAKSKKNVPDVKFIQSVSFAVRDIDEEIRHLQISIVQETETKLFRAYFDVVDPSKVKLATDGLS